MAPQQDSLFPERPEDLTALSDEELAGLLQEHNVAAELITLFVKPVKAGKLTTQSN